MTRQVMDQMKLPIALVKALTHKMNKQIQTQEMKRNQTKQMMKENHKSNLTTKIDSEDMKKKKLDSRKKRDN